MNIVPANRLFVNIEGHAYIEKNGQIFICHIVEINIIVQIQTTLHIVTEI